MTSVPALTDYLTNVERPLIEKPNCLKCVESGNLNLTTSVRPNLDYDNNLFLSVHLTSDSAPASRISRTNAFASSIMFGCMACCGLARPWMISP